VKQFINEIAVISDKLPRSRFTTDSLRSTHILTTYLQCN